MSTSIQPSLDFEKLPKAHKRRFVPEGADLCDLKQVKALYEQLLATKIDSVKAFEQWMLDQSELDAALDQQSTILYIRMTCQTDDESRAKAYEHFITTIVPAIKPIGHELNKKYLENLEKFPLDSKRYEVLTRDTKAEVELFVEKNIPLQTEVDLLSQEYQKVSGTMMVNFDGQERTLPQMSKYLLETDRTVREKAWRAVAERRLKDKDKLEDIFDKMLKLRDQIAKNAGCKNFIEYKFRSLHRFDYTPADCKTYHDTIEKLVLPLWKEILDHRKKMMKLDSLRPWDSEVDVLGRQPLKPFETVEQLIKGCEEIFQKLDPDFGRQFADMNNLNLLDLASRKGKAPGGYQSCLSESRKPFIFMNAVGLDGDIRTLLHEGGHAFHSLACRNEPLVPYRHGPMEFNEVSSMGMELLADEFLPVFYGKDDYKRSREAHLEDVIFILVWVATIDCFQHWIYENPGHSKEERKAFWLQTRRRFGANIMDWSGLEEVQAYLWHRQLHIFEVPFYYIEYGIAQLGALQLWRNFRKDRALAISQYKKAMSLGGSRPLPEIYQTAGIVFDFSAKTIGPLSEDVSKELKELLGE